MVDVKAAEKWVVAMLVVECPEMGMRGKEARAVDV